MPQVGRVHFVKTYPRTRHWTCRVWLHVILLHWKHWWEPLWHCLCIERNNSHRVQSSHLQAAGLTIEKNIYIYNTDTQESYNNDTSICIMSYIVAESHSNSLWPTLLQQLYHNHSYSRYLIFSSAIIVIITIIIKTRAIIINKYMHVYIGNRWISDACSRKVCRQVWLTVWWTG